MRCFTYIFLSFVLLSSCEKKSSKSQLEQDSTFIDKTVISQVSADTSLNKKSVKDVSLQKLLSFKKIQKKLYSKSVDLKCVIDDEYFGNGYSYICTDITIDWPFTSSKDISVSKLQSCILSFMFDKNITFSSLSHAYQYVQTHPYRNQEFEAVSCEDYNSSVKRQQEEMFYTLKGKCYNSGICEFKKNFSFQDHFNMQEAGLDSYMYYDIVDDKRLFLNDIVSCSKQTLRSVLLNNPQIDCNEDEVRQGLRYVKAEMLDKFCISNNILYFLLDKDYFGLPGIWSWYVYVGIKLSDIKEYLHPRIRQAYNL